MIMEYQLSSQQAMQSFSIASAIENQLAACKMQARGLNFFYGGFHALKDVNLVIAEREVTSLIGPSGCGKSTFLRCLNRMNDLIEGTRHTGEILLNGQDIYGQKVDAVALRKEVGMVFQKPNPFPMSIFDNVAYGPRIHGVRSKQELEGIVERCLRSAFLWDEVKDKLKQSGFSLSGGQQQRLCIARALSVNPSVILMDEPCSALDPIATGAIEELIKQLRQDYTVVVVTHNMQQAQRISDRTAFFMLGQIVEAGLTQQIFEAPMQRQTEDYVSGRFG